MGSLGPIAPKVQGYSQREPFRIRSSGFSDSRFGRPSQLLDLPDVRDILPQPRASMAFLDMMGGGVRKIGQNRPTNYKTVPCKNFAEEGVCRFGSSCTFKHGNEEIVTPTVVGRVIELRERLPVPLKSETKYKSVPCVSFIQSGFCQYGEECWFIHGNESTRSTMAIREVSF